MLTGLQLRCASEDCSGGMQACSNLPEEPLASHGISMPAPLHVAAG